jgi:hypothetical protein
LPGASATPEIHVLARRIAEAQIDPRRVRSARHDLLSGPMSDPDYDSPAAKRKIAKLALAAAKLRAKAELSPHLPQMSQFLSNLERSVQSPPDGPQKLATILADMTAQLAAMDRYERRAVSRRKFAIRAFDAARRQAASASNRVCSLLMAATSSG